MSESERLKQHIKLSVKFFYEDDQERKQKNYATFERFDNKLLFRWKMLNIN